MGNTRWRTFRFIFWTTILVLSGLFALLVLYLPPLLESILPYLASRAGMEPTALHIRRIGFSGLDLSDIIFRLPGTDPIRIDSIRIDYRFSELLKGRITEMRISGATIPLDFRSNPAKPKDTEAISAPSAEAPLPLPVKRGCFPITTLTVRNTTLSVKLPQTHIQLPIELTLQSSDDATKAPYALSGHVRLPSVAIDYGGIRVGNPLGTDHSILPIDLQFETNDYKHWECCFSPFLCTTAVGLAQIEGAGSFYLADSVMIAEANLKTTQVLGERASAVSIDHPLNGEIFALFDGRVPFGITFMGGITDISMTGKNLEGRIPGIDIRGDMTKTPSETSQFMGQIDIRDGKLSIDRDHYSISGLSAVIPVVWPRSHQEPVGQLRLESFSLGGVPLGSMRADFHQQDGGAVIAGKLRSSQLPNTPIPFEMAMTKNDKDEASHIRVAIPNFEIPEGTDLGALSKKAEGIKAKGKVSLSADFAFGKERPSGTITLGIREAGLKMPKNDLSLDGLAMDLQIADPFSFRSGPRQQIQLSKLSFGDITATDFIVDFQIESPDSLLIEQGRFKWCDGNVESAAFRISPASEEYRLRLTCDRLNLARILDQLGAAEAEGEGSVNGRIPVVFSKNQIRFEDGFLYSTPGGGGKIKLKKTQGLSAGFVSGSPEALQMEIAIEALKDFEYSWAKMNLGTEKNEMVIALKFDGKPAAPLPFVYKRDLGRFVRIEAGGQGSVFQGIRLDVNFRLPIDAILKYRGIIENFQ